MFASTPRNTCLFGGPPSKYLQDFWSICCPMNSSLFCSTVGWRSPHFFTWKGNLLSNKFPKDTMEHLMWRGPMEGMGREPTHQNPQYNCENVTMKEGDTSVKSQCWTQVGMVKNKQTTMCHWGSKPSPTLKLEPKNRRGSRWGQCRHQRLHFKRVDNTISLVGLLKPLISKACKNPLWLRSFDICRHLRWSL